MTKFIAHRGLSAIAPENTMAAFTLAWAHDADGIELDVQVSADGEVVVHHDESTLRCAGVDYAIAQTDWARLKTLDVGGWKAAHFKGEAIPRLNEVLEMMPTGKIVQVEIKPEVVNVAPIIACLQAARRDIDLIVMSFNAKLLSRVQAALPQLKTLWIVETLDAVVCEQALAAGFSGVDVDYRALDVAYVQRVQAQQLIVGVWTVNDKQVATELVAAGVEMIASDCVHELLAIADETKE